jgi:hypothetical protein
MHPLYEAALDFWCDTLGLSPKTVRLWISGERTIPDELAMLIERELGVPASSFRTHVHSPDHQEKPFRTRKPGKPVNPLEEAGRLGGKARAAKLQGRTGVHAGLKELGWTIGELASAITAHLGRKVSKSSVAFWALGSRPAGTKGAYYQLSVSAPPDVREAAEAVTGGLILPSAWP